jgi:hypothetical protein
VIGTTALAMPSRRTLLRSATAAAGGLLAGCASLTRPVDGYVQLKSITGVTSDDGTRVEETVVRVTLSSPPGAGPPELSHVDRGWADRFETPREPVVSDGLHEDLNRSYDTVRYVVGVCSPAWSGDEEPVGCYNVATTRENFDAVQVHDRVSVSSDGTYLSIHSVEGTWAFASG